LGKKFWHEGEILVVGTLSVLALMQCGWLSCQVAHRSGKLAQTFVPLETQRVSTFQYVQMIIEAA
jgi:hypothetical protein